MKKLLGILLAIGLVSCFVACNNQDDKKPSGSQQSGEQNNQEAMGTEIRLEGNPSTGYLWQATQYDKDIIKVEALENVPVDNTSKKSVGANKQKEQASGNQMSGNSLSGNQVSGEDSGDEGTPILGAPSIFRFKVTGLKAGSTELVFAYFRSWEGSASSVDEKTYVVTVDELLNVTATEKLPEPDIGDTTASKEMSTIINSLLEKSKITYSMPILGKIEAAVAQTYIGLTEEQFNQSIEDAAFYESGIMPSNSSLCVVKVKEGADVATIKQDILKNCDPIKWICMGAEKCLVIESGRYIMLIMSSTEDCEAFQKAFTTHFGEDNVGAPITKDGITEE